MKPSEEEALLARLAEITAAPKSFDTAPSWEAIQDRASARLCCTVALRIGGVLGGGAAIMIKTPREAWEEDVYGHIQVRRPNTPHHLRLLPVEWRPLGIHYNPGDAPPELRFLGLADRHHPFDLNQPLGISVFSQSRAGIARELPRAIASFEAYLDLCAELWNCPDVRSIERPPWSPKLV
jgi:hypothetical protein